jgi:hypothetical protein
MVKKENTSHSYLWWVKRGSGKGVQGSGIVSTTYGEQGRVIKIERRRIRESIDHSCQLLLQNRYKAYSWKKVQNLHYFNQSQCLIPTIMLGIYLS